MSEEINFAGNFPADGGTGMLTTLDSASYDSSIDDMGSLQASTGMTIVSPTLGGYEHQVTTFDVVYLVLLMITLLVGNIGNIMVIGAVLTYKPLRKEGNIFILNLAIADLSVTAFVDPFSVVGTMVGPDFFHSNDVLCHIIGSVCLVSCVCSLWSIAAISVNRYVLLCRPGLYRRIFTWRKTIGYALALWLGALLLDIPNFVDWGDHTYDMKTMACSYDRTASYSYTVFFIIWFVTLPLLTVLYCNINIYMVVLRSKIRVAAHQNMNNRTAADASDNGDSTAYAPVSGIETQISHVKVTNTTVITSDSEANKMSKNGEQLAEGTKNPARTIIKPKPRTGSKTMKAEIKLAKTLFIIFIVFCVAWTPYAILCLYDKKDTIAKEAYAISILMAHGSSTVNSLLYAFTNKSFRDGYKAFLSRCGMNFCFN